MISREQCLKTIKSFRARNGIEASDENIIATIHLMNTHAADLSAGLDQSSRSGNDHGVDAWFYDEASNQLFVYQSKLTESRTAALRGLGDLDAARQWLEQVLIDGTIDVVPSGNHCLFNLYTTLSQKRGTIQKLRFCLVSAFEKNELEDSTEAEFFQNALAKSRLNEFIRKERNGKLHVDLVQYNLEAAVPETIKTYPITKLTDSRINLRKNAHLDLAYVPLCSLIELYRERGDVLFDKNVRLSLMGIKEAKDRLVHPLENTFNSITSGNLSPQIFPFYHIGVTVAASASTSDTGGLLNLEAPSIINGCQTITIANEYLKRLEKMKDEAAIALFREIKVIAKVVVGTTNEELKEITNANNRQNPIENWQLFSNESIHIEIEQVLKDAGVFYERQKGKFDTVMKNADNARYYINTNGTYIRVVDLGQVIAVARRYLAWAAKPSEIFLNAETHSKVFDKTIPKFARDVVFCINLQKAIKRGIYNYLQQPTHSNSNAPRIFNKPMMRAHMSRLALLYFYQLPSKETLRADYSTMLQKIAPMRLVEEVETFCMKVVSKTKNWYTKESKGLEIEVSKKSLSAFFDTLETELGIDAADGAIPFSARAVDWKLYDDR